MAAEVRAEGRSNSLSGKDGKRDEGGGRGGAAERQIYLGLTIFLCVYLILFSVHIAIDISPQ